MKNAAAAKIKMAAFTKNARFKAIAVSIKLNFRASFIPKLVFSILRVCTKEECRYKLCGITVAPIIPIAMYNALPSKLLGISPFAISFL